MSCPNVQIRVLPDPGIMAETGSRFSKSSDPDLFETPAPKPQFKNLVIQIREALASLTKNEQK